MELDLQNPWWTDSQWSQRDPHLLQVSNQPYCYARPEVRELAKLGEGGIQVIRGPRQVGKTTLLKEIIAAILAQGLLPPERILYLSCETLDDYSALENAIGVWLKDTGGSGAVFLDEISFVKEWPRAILAFSNLGWLREKSVFITGSNARDLKESGERLPGRRGSGKDIRLFPFGLSELKEIPFFKGRSDREMFEIYLKIGGFPAAVKDFATYGLVTDTTYETYRNWIIGDAIHYQLSGEILTQILYRIYETLSSRVTWSGLIETTHVRSHETAYSYLQHLEDAFIASILLCYDEKKDAAALNKARKIYFVDPSLYVIAYGWKTGIQNAFSWYLRKLEDPEFRGKIFESLVVNRFKRERPRVYFWYSSKTQQEVDLVVPGPEKILQLFEAKLGQVRESKPILKQHPIVITPDEFQQGRLGN